MLLAIVVVAGVRLHLAGAPLERDEGEYAYAGQLILHGVPPYRLACGMKFPGTYYAYALILSLFGETARGIRVGLLLVNAATIGLVFALGRRLLGPLEAAIAAISFAVLTLDPWIMGLFAHATHFVVLPALAGLLVALRAAETPRTRPFLWSGLLLGLAVLMKQHAVFFLPLAAALAVRGAWQRRPAGARLAALALGAAIPFGVLCTVLLWQGVLRTFWFWTFVYARAYVRELPLAEFLPQLSDSFAVAARANLPLWLLAAAGLIPLLSGAYGAEAGLFTTGLLLASFLAVCPGFFFRAHYFILMLPAIALQVGVAFGYLGRLLARLVSPRASQAIAAALFAAVAGGVLFRARDSLLFMTPRELIRARYLANPFVEAVDVARYIRERTTSDDRIAVLGSEPEIYFYADRRSATVHIYTYPLVESQPFASQMQAEMIAQIESAHPTYLVYVKVMASWLAGPASDKTIFAWTTRYAASCYDLVGIADMIPPDATRYVWDEAVKSYQPSSSNLILVFRRKSDQPCAVGRVAAPATS